VVDVVEESANINLNHPVMSGVDPLAHRLHRLLRRALRPEPERARLEGRLDDRLQHQTSCGLHHSITNPGYPKWPPALAVSFEEIDPPDRGRPLQVGFQLV